MLYERTSSLTREGKLVLTMNNLKPKTALFFVLALLCALIVATVIYFLIAGVQFTQSAFKKKVEHIDSLPSTAMFPSNIDCFYFTDKSCMCFTRSSIIIEEDTIRNRYLSDHVQPGDSVIKEPYNVFLKIVKSKK